MMNIINNFFKLMYSPYGKIGRLKFVFGCFAAFGLYLLYCLTTGYLVAFFVGVLNPMGSVAANQAYLHSLTHNVVETYTIPIYILIMIFHYVVLLMKRIRDIGGSPWYSLVIIVPILNVVAVAILLFLPGKSTDPEVKINAA